MGFGLRRIWGSGPLEGDCKRKQDSESPGSESGAGCETASSVNKDGVGGQQRDLAYDIELRNDMIGPQIKR